MTGTNMANQRDEFGAKNGIFRSMVCTVLMYALDAHVLTFTQTQRLEAAHTRMLRRIARSPSHLEKEHNCKLRHRLMVFSVSSVLTHARLRFLNKALTAQEDNIAVLAALFGKSEMDGMAQPTIYTSKRLRMIAQDMLSLHNALPVTERPTIPWDTLADTLTPHSLEWFAALEAADIKTVLSYDSKAERSSNIKVSVANQPTLVCNVCTAKTDTEEN